DSLPHIFRNAIKTRPFLPSDESIRRDFSPSLKDKHPDKHYYSKPPLLRKRRNTPYPIITHTLPRHILATIISHQIAIRTYCPLKKQRRMPTPCPNREKKMP